MKGLLIIGAFLAVAVVGFVVFVRFGAANGSEPTTLTQQVSAFVDSSEEERDRRLSDMGGYRVAYTYEVGGRSYSSDSWVSDNVWTPARGLVAICVDPDDPARHVVPTLVGAECDGGNTGRNDEQRAEPLSLGR